MNTDETYYFLVQPHELKQIEKVLRRQKITTSQDAFGIFITNAIKEKIGRDWKVNHNVEFLKRQVAMEETYTRKEVQ